jgi:SsrA-binding protein
MQTLRNRRAGYDYLVIERWTAGVSLLGSEVKAIKAGHVDFTGAWCELRAGSLLCRDLYVKESESPYSHRSDRERPLLLTKKELKKIDKMMDKGLTVIPLSIWVNDRGLIKMDVGLCRGKKTWDKRETIRARDLSRDLS